MLWLIVIFAAIYTLTVITFMAAVTKLIDVGMKHLTRMTEQAHDERLALIRERDALLERIQRPEYRPAAPWQEEETTVMETPEADFALVGTVVSEATDGE